MGERALAFLQGGLEETKGTAIAAKRVLLTRLTAVNVDDSREFVEQQRGSFASAYTHMGRVKSYGLSFEGEATYEELPWWFRIAVQGNVGASVVNVAGRRYVYSPFAVSSNSDDLQSATIQWGDETQGWQASYVEVDNFSLGFGSLSAGGAFPLTFRAEAFAKAIASNTKTAGLSAITVEPIDASLGTFQLGTTSTGFSSLTSVTGSLRQFELTLNNGLARKVTVGSGDTYASLGRGKRRVTFTGVIEGNSDAVTRFVEWDTATEKRVRVKFAGTGISGASPVTARELWIDGRVVFTKVVPLGEVDTNTVFAVEGRYIYDSTLNSDVSFTVTNDQATTAYV